ncbi:hypothetical protein UF75_5490 [Desulfosporosinus sp. I2]|nr:hypothetical protein UF75_5490 [Desulfosporosinus sp. I2]
MEIDSPWGTPFSLGSYPFELGIDIVGVLIALTIRLITSFFLNFCV